MRSSLRAAAAGLLALAGAAYLLSVAGRSEPVSGWLFLDLGRIWAWSALLLVGCAGAGLLVLRALSLHGDPPLERLATALPLGVVVFTLVLYAAGAVGLLVTPLAVALPVLLAVAGGRELARLARDAPRAEAISPLSLAVTAFGAAALLLLVLEALTPDAISFDATWYHLPIAEAYARHHRIVAFPGDYNRAFPHLASFLYTWAFLLPARVPQLKWMQAQSVEVALFLATLPGIAALVRHLLGGRRVAGAWAAVFFFPGLFVYDGNLGTGADHVLAFFGPALVLELLRCAEEDLDPRRAAVAGALLGGAALTKYQAVYFAAGAAVVLVPPWVRALRRRAGRRAWLSPLVFAGVGALVAAPHFVKNLVFFGNPVYPFAQDLFPSHPGVPRASFLVDHFLKDRRWLPPGAGARKLWEALKTTFTFSFVPHYSFTKDVPSFGSLFTLCLPLLLVVRERRRTAWAALFALAGVLAWALTLLMDRYLQALVPVMAAVTAAVLVKAWELGPPARAGVAALVGLQLVWGADAAFSGGHPRLASAVNLLRSTYEGRTADAQRWDHRASFVSLGRALPRDAVLLLHGHRVSLGIDRDLVLDYPGWQGLIDYSPMRGPRDAWERYRALGITHVARVLRAPADSLQIDVLVSETMTRGRPLGRFGNMDLVELPREAPEAIDPYRVLVLGAAHADGVYRLEQLGTYLRIPHDPLPAPAPSVGRGEAELQGALAGVQAVVVGAGVTLPPPVQSALVAGFRAGVTYGGDGGYTVWLRSR